MPTEKQAQEGLQALVQAMPEFINASVVINDWGVLDGSVHGGPFFIIENSDEFSSTQVTVSPEDRWNLTAGLFVRFTTWKQTGDAFRDARQALVDMMKLDANRALGITSGGGVMLQTIRPLSEITPVYDP